ncbi:hypothetical protein V6260_19005, partial [Pseudoalteromonas aliena]
FRATSWVNTHWFLGLTHLVSAVTGLIIHRKMIKKLFTFRREKGLDIAESDAYKVIVIWGRVFNILIPFTGAY